VRTRDLEDLPLRGGKRRVHGRGIRRKAARDVLRRLVWLKRPLVWWAGAPPERPCSDMLAARSLERLLCDRLAGQPAGLYAPAISGDDLNPTVGELCPVDERLVAQSTRGLLDARRDNPALEKVVGDVATWRAAAEAQLTVITAALRGVRAGGAPALAAEGAAWWLGPERSRPSLTVSVEALRDHRDRARPGHVACAVALGRRGERRGGLAALGAALGSWPLDLIVRLVGADRQRLRELLTLSRRSPSLDSDAGVAALDELRLLADDDALYEALPFVASLTATAGGVDGELARRKTVFLAAVYEAAAQAPRHPFPPLHLLSQRLSAMQRSLSDSLQAAGGGLAQKDGAYLGDALEALSTHHIGYPVRVESGDVVAQLKGEPTSPGEALTALITPLVDAVVSEDEPWRLTALSLAGRLAARCGDPSVLEGTARWLRSARGGLPPAQSGGAWMPTVSILSAIALEAGGDQRAIRDTVRGLADHADHLLAAALVEERRRPNHQGKPVSAAYIGMLMARRPYACVRAFARLGLDASTMARLAELGLLWHANLLTRLPPRQIHAFLENTAALDVPWSSLEPNPRAQLVLLHTVPDAALRGRLRDWTIALVTEHGFTWTAACACLNETRNRILALPGGVTEAQAFILREWWLVERATTLALRFGETSEGEAWSARDDNWANTNSILTDALDWLLLARHWEREGRGPLAPLIAGLTRDFLEACAPLAEAGSRPDVMPSWGESLEVIAALAPAAQARALCDLLSERSSDASLKGWRLVREMPEVTGLLRAAMNQRALWTRVLDWLQLVELVARLPPGRRLRDVLTFPVPEEALALPGWLTEAERASVLAMAALRAERGQPLPRRVRKALDRREAITRERAALNARVGAQPGLRARLEKLERWLSDGDGLVARSRADLSAALSELTPLVHLEALEARTRAVLEAHWRSNAGAAIALDDPDWLNALSLLGSTDRNRRILRRLLRQRATGHLGLMRHGGNAAFFERERAAGRDPDGWRAPLALRVTPPRRELVATAEDDPLKILQMGNLFNTCLSVGGCNQHAAVANAVEANKRVIYVRDGERIIARRLVALSREGQIAAFEIYGDDGPWIRILLDRACLALAQRSRAPMLDMQSVAGRTRSELRAAFALFSDWYYDGVEALDWWASAPGDGLQRIFDDPDYALSSDRREGTVRCLIASGDAALPALRQALPQLTREERTLLASEASSETLRETLSGS